jgi:hypothetical protein
MKKWSQQTPQPERATVKRSLLLQGAGNSRKAGDLQPGGRHPSVAASGSSNLSVITSGPRQVLSCLGAHLFPLFLSAERGCQAPSLSLRICISMCHRHLPVAPVTLTRRELPILVHDWRLLFDLMMMGVTQPPLAVFFLFHWATPSTHEDAVGHGGIYL